MAKGYWIGRVSVTDEAAYRRYVEANAAALTRFRGRFLVRGGRHEAVEGESRERNVVIEFPDYDVALECYRSPEYAEAMSHRVGAAVADIVVVEGYDGPQPGE
jgi:uncharacterized protein (DUF1330 family)